MEGRGGVCPSLNARLLCMRASYIHMYLEASGSTDKLDGLPILGADSSRRQKQLSHSFVACNRVRTVASCPAVTVICTGTVDVPKVLSAASEHHEGSECKWGLIKGAGRKVEWQQDWH